MIHATIWRARICTGWRHTHARRTPTKHTYLFVAEVEGVLEGLDGGCVVGHQVTGEDVPGHERVKPGPVAVSVVMGELV